MEVRWETKHSWNTEHSADSVEWCPVDGYSDVMVCGTYQLQKDGGQGLVTAKQERIGRIYLFIINSTAKTLEPIQTIEAPGILDQKWCCHEIKNYPVLATATSIGKLQLYQLTKEDDTLRLKLWMEECVKEDLLALSVDWSTNKISGDPNLVVSDSSGTISLWSIGNNKLTKIGVWNAHGFEAWIASFNYWHPNIFYSGGDDCLFKSFDTRVPDVAVSTNRAHEAGVTAIRSHVNVEHQLLTGSYDEKVRLWDPRNLKRCVTEENAKGGVWRLKWHPHKDDTVLAACMYGGFRILQLHDTSLEVVSEYLEHDSIAYGADFKWDQHWHAVATCSFYDSKLNISEIKF